MIWIDPKHESGELHIVAKNSDGTMKYTDPLKHDSFEANFTQARNISVPVRTRGFNITKELFEKVQALTHIGSTFAGCFQLRWLSS